jgi:hypothetical protein
MNTALKKQIVFSPLGWHPRQPLFFFCIGDSYMMQQGLSEVTPAGG